MNPHGHGNPNGEGSHHRRIEHHDDDDDIYGPDMEEDDDVEEEESLDQLSDDDEDDMDEDDELMNDDDVVNGGPSTARTNGGSSNANGAGNMPHGAHNHVNAGYNYGHGHGGHHPMAAHHAAHNPPVNYGGHGHVGHHMQHSHHPHHPQQHHIQHHPHHAAFGGQMHNQVQVQVHPAQVHNHAYAAAAAAHRNGVNVNVHGAEPPQGHNENAPQEQQRPPPQAQQPLPPAQDANNADVNANQNANANANPAQNSANSSTDASIDIDNEPPLDGYERTDRIGQGAYGIVYRGTQRSTGHTVAIKRIPFADAAPEGGVPCNVIREISLLRELEHPNVVRLLDVNQARPGELYLVFEFVAHDLKTYLDRSQPGYKEKGADGAGNTEKKSSGDVSRRQGLAPHVVRDFMRQILEGVGYCHTYRILHRDLKPHNLLISSDGRQVKLADFGLARLSGLPSGPYTSEVVTLWYRAPELLLGATRYCGPVDVWSIGCIFAEMATGYALFPGRSDIDQLFKIFQRRGTPVNEPTLNRLPHYNAEFPKWKARNITDFVNLDAFGGAEGHAADLLEQLLQYNPENRLICKQALHHPFFFEPHE